MRKVSKEALDMIPGVLNFADKTLKLLSLMNGTAVLYIFTVTKLDTSFSWYGWFCFIAGLTSSAFGYLFAYLSQDKAKDSLNFLKNKQNSESVKMLEAAKVYRKLGIASVVISIFLFLIGCLVVSSGCKGHPYEKNILLEKSRK